MSKYYKGVQTHVQPLLRIHQDGSAKPLCSPIHQQHLRDALWGLHASALWLKFMREQA